MSEPVTVRPLLPQEARERIDALSAVLIDCVEGGASVSFMAPLSYERASAFWQVVAEGVAAGERILLVAEDRSGARRAGKTVLVLDTVTGSDGERLYARLGWERVGVIPNYALWPRGGLCDTTYFHKQISPA